MMWKRLAIFTVFLFVTSADFPSPRKTANPKANAASQENQTTQSEQPLAFGATAAPQASYSATFNDYPDHKTDKDGWDKAAVFANYFLVIIGVAGIIAAICTLLKLERQTKATERQVQASHDGLRAWIGIEVCEKEPISEATSFQALQQNAALAPQPPRFVWKVKNYGQTPAFITKVGADVGIYQDTMMLHVLSIPKMREVTDFIGAGKERENAVRTGSFMYREVITKAKYWRVIFKIEYRDVFDQERIHETVASFHYYIAAGEGDPIDTGFYQEHNPANNYNT